MTSSLFRIAISFALSSLMTISAADFYVDFDDPNAEDNNGVDNGTITKPFKTIGYALDKNFKPATSICLSKYDGPNTTSH